MLNVQKYIGLDIHRKFIYSVIMDIDGNIISDKKLKNDPQVFEKYFENIDKDSKIALESCSCWEYVYDFLADMGFRCLQLANPSRIRLIAESNKKTDRHDAKVLADLLRTNMLPTSYAPTELIRQQRQLTRHRADVGRLKADIKNKIHAILIRHGIDYEFSDLFGNGGIKYLRSLDLPYIDRYKMDNYLSLIRHYDTQILDIQERIKEFVLEMPQVEILKSMPGIGSYSGLMIFSEIGDIRRFSHAKKLASFAGLNPRVYQSGNKCITGHISKQGSKNLRWILVQCAHVAVMHDSNLAKTYHRIRKRRGNKVATVAVARKMLSYIFTMLKNNVKYQDLQINKKKAS